MNNICSVICGAPCKLLQKEFVTGCIIAADSGLDAALATGIIPDIVVGDFDSAVSEIPNGAECIRVSPIKDDTDTLLAANTAIERGCMEIRFFRALGGRLDHTFANIQMLYDLKLKGIRSVLFGDNERLYFLRDQTHVVPRYDGFLSVFAFGGNAELSEQGVQYPLSHHTMTECFPLGVSNVITSETAEITVHKGTAMIIESYSDNSQYMTGV